MMRFDPTRPETKQWPMITLLACVCIVLIGCGAKIGDECSSSVDCGLSQVCDTSQPGGYCTARDCAVDSCPDDSVCIKFDTKESYCMAVCYNDDDCRSDYVCIEDYGVHSFCNATEQAGVQ